MQIKKTIYIILTMFLGVLLAVIAFGLLDIRYLNSGAVDGLPGYASAAFFLAGLIGGYFLGQTWWRIVYVEHRHWRRIE
ncbi:MAG: hypothetical protein WC120_01655 [Parcubacteria group bacterium]